MTPEAVDELYNLFQYAPDDVEAITAVLESHGNDAAYLVGVVAKSLLCQLPEQFTIDPATNAQRARIEKMVYDLLTLKRRWFFEYPDLEAAFEERRTSRPETPLHVV